MREKSGNYFEIGELTATGNDCYNKGYILQMIQTNGMIFEI